MRDWAVLVDLPHTTSLRSLADVHHTTAQNLSKIIRRVEDNVGFKIMDRTPQGIQCNEAGFWLAELAERILEPARSADLGQAPGPAILNRVRTLTMAARGFLNASLAGPICHELLSLQRPTRVRFVDLSPVEISLAGRNNQIDLAITQSDEPLSSMWQSQAVGELLWNFFARTDHPLFKGPKGALSLSKIKGLSVIQNCFYEGTRINESNRFLPMRFRSGGAAHATETAATAISILRDTDQIAFLPVISVANWLISGEIRAIHLQGAERESQSSQPLYLTYHAERTSPQMVAKLSARIQKELNRLNSLPK